MDWTERGAHLLLQIRTHVLNTNWRFRLPRWCPGIEKTLEAKAAIAVDAMSRQAATPAATLSAI
jgi:hypothetical protein